MGGCDQRIKELWHYKTIFGGVTFNVISTTMSIIQILTTCILLGYYHSYVTIEFLWWPVFESIRLFILTIARMDVLLKHVSEYRSNARAFEQTRRILMLCNLIGAASVCIGAPVFLILLPNGTHLYTALVTCFPIFMLCRLLLSLPMIWVLTCGTALYRSHDGNAYERINDFPTDHNRDSGDSHHSNEDENRGDNDNDNDNERGGSAHRERSRLSQELLYSMLEQRQMETAMEESRRQSLRARQEEDYEEAIRQQQQMESMQSMQSQSAQPNTADYQPVQQPPITALAASSIAPQDVAIPISTPDAFEPNDEPTVQLQDLPPEPPESYNVVSVRIRLPNGTRSKRRFGENATISDVQLWVNHQLLNNDSVHICNKFRLISTMPRVVYDDQQSTMRDLRFWRPNAKRTLLTPVLYVEEFAANEAQ